MQIEATIVVPIFNEINSLYKLCTKLKKTFKDFKIKYIFITQVL